MSGNPGLVESPGAQYRAMGEVNSAARGAALVAAATFSIGLLHASMLAQADEVLLKAPHQSRPGVGHPGRISTGVNALVQPEGN